MVLSGTLFKSSKVQLDFQKKKLFSWKVSLFTMKCFMWLVLGNCIVHAVIFSNKYLVNLFRTSFCEFLKKLILILIIFKMLERLWHVNFFKFIKKCKLSKNQKHHWQRLKKRLAWCFWIFNILFWSNLKKLTSNLLFPELFRKT